MIFELYISVLQNFIIHSFIHLLKPFGKLSNVITILYNLKTLKIGEVLIKLLLMNSLSGEVGQTMVNLPEP